MKLPRWKREQKERKQKKLAVKMRFLGLVIILGLVILGIFSFLQIYLSSVLPKNGRTTILFSTSPVKVLTFDQEGKVIFLQLPDNLYMEKRNGGLLAGSIQEFLGAPIDAVVTDLNLWDRLKIWWKISSTKTNQRQTIELSVGLTVDRAKLDKQLAGIFKDSEVVSEHLTIEVLNGSNKPEMANRAARLITNLGGTVISLGNSEKESGECEIKASVKILKTQTAQRLKKIFNCKEILLKPGESRADLQLIIGLDYWRKMNEK